MNTPSAETGKLVPAFYSCRPDPESPETEPPRLYSWGAFDPEPPSPQLVRASTLAAISSALSVRVCNKSMEQIPFILMLMLCGWNLAEARSMRIVRNHRAEQHQMPSAKTMSSSPSAKLAFLNTSGPQSGTTVTATSRHTYFFGPTKTTTSSGNQNCFLFKLKP